MRFVNHHSVLSSMEPLGLLGSAASAESILTLAPQKHDVFGDCGRCSDKLEGDLRRIMIDLRDVLSRLRSRKAFPRTSWVVLSFFGFVQFVPKRICVRNKEEK